MFNRNQILNHQLEHSQFWMSIIKDPKGEGKRLIYTSKYIWPDFPGNWYYVG